MGKYETKSSGTEGVWPQPKIVIINDLTDSQHKVLIYENSVTLKYYILQNQRYWVNVQYLWPFMSNYNDEKQIQIMYVNPYIFQCKHQSYLQKWFLSLAYVVR